MPFRIVVRVSRFLFFWCLSEFGLSCVSSVIFSLCIKNGLTIYSNAQTHALTDICKPHLCSSFTTVCPPVQGDNPRAFEL